MPDKDYKIETSAGIAAATGNVYLEFLKTVLVLAALIVIFRFYIFMPFVVRGISMEPNFHDGQYLIVNEISYHFSSPKRGDAVIFKHPEPACNDFIANSYINRVFVSNIIPNPPCTNYIKRIIGLPGETVTIGDGRVIIKNAENPNGFELKENYIVEGLSTLTQSGQTETFKVGEKEYFVLGDNREPNASSDSRDWGILPRNFIIGKAYLVLYPFNELELVKRADYK